MRVNVGSVATQPVLGLCRDCSMPYVMEKNTVSVSLSNKLRMTEDFLPYAMIFELTTE
jgi:hypothetical protein